ncbi:MAG TPA: adenylyl-sulfate kinase [Gemmatimonadaceae bacterium]|nr:adenylyl-sulfate kinase [Gemmatimonadaceae bacterium]
MTTREPRMGIVITGHVDHGKSTVVGRLLADTGSLPDGKLEQVRAHCAATARPFEYAFLLDALKDEQAQGITIDSARVFFNSGKRHYVILDAPGHIEFLKNMITGAAHAEAALLVIDALEGIRENSRRHGYMLAMLGVRQVAVIVNKMDLIAYDQTTFEAIADEFRDFLRKLDVEPSCFIPVSGRHGDNVAGHSDRMPWHSGPTVLEALDAFTTDRSEVERPFRMPVQSVYKFTEEGDDRRIVAGTVLTGSVFVGDEVLFLPSGKRSRIRSIEAFNAGNPTSAVAGSAIGFTLDEQIYVPRGEIAVRIEEPRPQVTTRLRVSVFWLGPQPLVKRREYALKLGTARVPVRLEAVHRVLDASTLAVVESPEEIGRNDVAECVLELGRSIAFDLVSDIPETGRFVLVEDYEIRGGGIIREALPDRQSWVRDRVLLRNYKWEPSDISGEQRATRFGQRSRLVLITGEQHADRKAVARELERRLFADGRVVYFLGIGNILYGVDADLGRAAEDRREHMRRLAEIANLMLDAGVILIVTAAELTTGDLEIIREGVDEDRITTVWLGPSDISAVPRDLTLSDQLPISEAADQIKALLDDQEEPGGQAAVLWFTGLSGSGKSTIAARVVEELERRGDRVEHLDGDTIRDIFPEIGFTRAERDAHIRQVGFLASRLERNGVIVVASLISPYEESRSFVRQLCDNFIEIYVATPIEECERRDIKGLYARARGGEIPNFTGIDAPYEIPVHPELTIDTREMSVDDAAAVVLNRVREGKRNRHGPSQRHRSPEHLHTAGSIRELQTAGDAVVDRKG